VKRLTLLVILGLLTASPAFADPIPLITKISLTSGKSMEGGIAVNPVTHKAYVIAELAAEGADDEKVVFVIDSDALKDAKRAPKKISLSPGTTTDPLKWIPIPNENEYMAIDSDRNLIYVGTRFSVEQEESDADTETDADGGGEVEAPGGVDAPDPVPVTALEPAPVIRGTLTVIDGNTDTVIATWYFPPGIEPEGVAVDPANGVVYLGAKAPEGEADADDHCSSGVPIFDVGEPGDVECWTAGHIYAFSVDPALKSIRFLKDIPAGDDPESVVFADGMVYAANEDDGTVTIASAVNLDGTGGELLTDQPRPPVEPYESGLAPYDLGVFYDAGPNPLACAENKFEADKMAAGGGSVFITDDRSRVAKITGTTVAGVWDVPGASVCEQIPNSDGGGLNSANNIAFMQKSGGGKDGGGLLYVVSEQNTVAMFDPETMKQRGTVTIPGAQHLDGIAVDAAATRVWITDEVLNAVFVLQGACANGTGNCIN